MPIKEHTHEGCEQTASPSLPQQTSTLVTSVLGQRRNKQVGGMLYAGEQYKLYRNNGE